MVHFCSYIETDQKTQVETQTTPPNSLEMKEKGMIRQN